MRAASIEHAPCAVLLQQASYLAEVHCQYSSLWSLMLL